MHASYACHLAGQNPIFWLGAMKMMGCSLVDGCTRFMHTCCIVLDTNVTGTHMQHLFCMKGSLLLWAAWQLHVRLQCMRAHQ